MVKSATPAYVLFFSTLFGLEQPTWQLVVVVMVIIIGIALCSLGEIKFAISGFLFVCLASAAAGMRWAVSHLYLSSKDTSSPVELLYKSLPSAFIALPIFCAIFEAEGLKQRLATMTSLHVLYLFFLIVVFAVLGFIMVYVELTLVKRISSLSFSVLAVFKELLVVSLSIVLNHDGLDMLNWLGFVITLVGVLCFKYLRQEHHILHDEFAESPLEEAENIFKSDSKLSNNHQQQQLGTNNSTNKGAGSLNVCVVQAKPTTSTKSSSYSKLLQEENCHGASHSEDEFDEEPL
jgi:drug/metabolite transporter (DMT)-like permease